MDFLLFFYDQKDLKQNCEHSAKIANKPSDKIASKQNDEQTGVSERLKISSAPPTKPLFFCWGGGT